jgi:hypothetical protein
MNHLSLTFLSRIDCSANDEITMEVDLVSDGLPVTVGAKLDTGSKFCVFNHVMPNGSALTSLAVSLSLSALPQDRFQLMVTKSHLHVGDLQWEATVYFAEPEDFPINVVGRIGFLDHLQIGLVDYEQLLYLGPYESP